MRKLPQKKQWDQRNAGRTRRQPSNCLLSPEQQEMRRSAFQFTIAIPKMWFGHPPPQQPEPIGLNKPSRKEACPKTSRYQPAFRPMFAFRPAPMPTRRPCLPGVHAHLTPMLAWHSHFDRCSVSTGAHVHLAPMPIRHPCFVKRSCSPGTHASPDTQERSQRHIPCTDFRN